MRYQVGDLTVTAVSDGTIDIGREALINLGPEATALVGDRAALRASVNTFVVQGRGRTVLIDTGAATSMGPTMGQLLPNLVAAGVQPADVDLVLVTHFHPDHANGLTTAEGVAVFPNAGLVAAEAEVAFWLRQDAEAAPTGLRPYVLAAQAMARPYTDRLVMAAGEVAPGITAVALPGHTPGHTGYRIGSGADSLLVWGDIMHLPELQGPHPEVGLVYDLDAAQAVATRQRVLDMVVVERLPIAGMHVTFPGITHVERRGSGYGLVPA